MISSKSWTNQNSYRDYPFTEGSSLTANNSVLGKILTLPRDLILDLRLSNCLTHGYYINTLCNIDYLVYSIQKVGTQYLDLNIRQVFREVYASSNPLTYTNIGKFRIPFTFVSGQTAEFTPNSGVEITGKLLLGSNSLSKIANGIHYFGPEALTLEYSVCIPKDESARVDSLSTDGIVKLEGEVDLREGHDVELDTFQSGNTLKISFSQDVVDCSKSTKCSEDPELSCGYPTLMRVNGVGGNSAFSLNITGSNAINVSALAVPGEGSDPFNPSTFIVRGIVITYQGPMYYQANIDNPENFEDYTYGFDCGLAGGNALLSELNQKLQKIEDSKSEIEGIIYA